jgi:hypothetical protein
MRTIVLAVAAVALTVGGLAGCSTDAVNDRIDNAVADQLETTIPGGLPAVCDAYHSAGVDKAGLVDLLRKQFGGQDISDALGLPVHVDNEKLLSVIADRVVSACS